MRALVDEALGRIVSGERADRVLDRVLRAHRELSSEERARVARWSLALSVWRGRYHVLAGDQRQLWLALYLVEREARDAATAAAIAGVRCDDVVRALARPVDVADAAERMAFECSLPLWLARRWIAQFGAAEALAVAAAMNKPGPVALRANAARVSRDELLRRLALEGVAARVSTVAPHAVLLEGRANLFGLQAWRQGLFEVQDEGSQLVAEAVRARPGALVVDLCAGSGGKTLALAAAMRGAGRLVAVDRAEARLRDLSVRLRRAGVEGVEVRAGDSTDSSLLADLAGRADAVLLDAPCSELGVLRRSPDARWRMAADAPDSFAPLQKALLQAAARLVREGGRLVYATCSIDAAENEAVAATLGDAQFERQETRQLRPDRDGCDGFFIASWQRGGDGRSAARQGT